MASSIFARYIWLVDLLRQRKRLTYEQINQLWQESGLSYGKGDELPLRTFHNHRKAIFDIFNISIECDTKNGYKYYIDAPEELENDNLRSWLIDSFATMNLVKADQKLEKRIQFENIPSGHAYLTQIAEAMRKNKVIIITHQGFDRNNANNFEIEPYCLKIFNRRWYVIARSPYLNEVRTYGLDRIRAIEETDKKFKMPKDFSIEEYFDGCCGIITDKTLDIERVVIKAYAYARKYLSTLPIHTSQKAIADDDESITFEYHVRPTFDFFQTLFAQADQIEVLEPQWVRDEMKHFAKKLLSYYQ